MLLLIDDDEREAYPNLYSDSPAPLGIWTAGGTVPLTVMRLKRNNPQYDSKLFTPQTLSGYTMRAALGGGFLLPTSGTWPISFNKDMNTVSTGWIIPANPSSDDIQNALNSLDTGASVYGGVVVQGQDGFFEITFNNMGAQSLLSGNPARLVPLSLLTFATIVTGDDNTQAVQTLRIAQNTGALVDLTADTNASTITQANVVVGDGTHNAQIRVTLPTSRYGGTWSFTKGAGTVSNLGWSDSDAQIQSALQAVLGANNVLVYQDSVDSYVFTFTGSLGLAAITITLDGSGLSMPDTMSGSLDLTAAGVDWLFQDSDSAIAQFEIEATPSGGSAEKIYQADVQIRRPVLTASSVAPSGVQSLEAYSGAEADSSISTGQTITLSPATRFLQWFKLITLGAGSGAYTVYVVLDRTNAVTGAIFRVELDFAQSGNPTVNICDSVISNVIDTIPGNAAQAQYYLSESQFRGGVYYKLSGQFQ